VEDRNRLETKAPPPQALYLLERGLSDPESAGKSTYIVSRSIPKYFIKFCPRMEPYDTQDVYLLDSGLDQVTQPSPLPLTAIRTISQSP
jgi:hypothetical protein